MKEDGCFFCSYDCDTNCKFCLNGVCNSCNVGFEYNIIENRCDQIYQIQEDEFYDSNVIYNQFELNYQNCIKNCIQCQFNKCLLCNLGYDDEQCLPYCGDGIVVLEEQCDDNNIYEYDGCFNCKFSCPQFCLSCYQGTCLICENQYYLFMNTCYLNFNQINNYIENNQKCGNNIVEQYEFCDDNNNFQFDGCFECQYSCNLNCKDCQFGKCIACFDDYILINEHQCSPKCGDGKVAIYSTEQCDDTNYIQFDGCFNCLIECKQNCLFCNELQCFRCQQGYIPNGLNCESMCGDGIIISMIEECDDGNSIYEDGCYNCKLTCGDGCIECSNGECLGNCYDGFKFVNNFCQEICGDGLLVGLEECDDDNLIEFDGCHNCKYSCPLFCDICELGICKKCQLELQLVNQLCILNNTSVQVNSSYYIYDCGNGIKNEQEECDDGNLIPLDGCFQCLVEDDWVCNSIGSCEYNKAPKVLLIYLNQTNSKQYIDCHINQDIIINDNQKLLHFVYIYLEDIEAQQYQINYFNEQKSGFILEVKINQEFYQKPKLILEINQDLCNSFGQCIEDKIVFTNLNIPIYVQPEILEQAKNLSSSNKYIIIIIVIISILSVLLGDLEILFEKLATLQFQSYIKYVNLNYPENLLIYFESSSVVSIYLIIDFLNLNHFVDSIQFNNETDQATGKFQYYSEDTDLLNNLLVQIIEVIIIAIIILSDKIIQKLSLKIVTSKWYYRLVFQMSQQLGFNKSAKIYKVFTNIPKNIYKLKRNLNFKSLRTILILNAWDILFKSFLYISQSQPFLNNRNFLQTLLSNLIIISYIFATYQGFIINQNRVIKQFEYFESFELIRTMIFSLSLAFFQKSQIQQVLIIAISNLFQLLVLMENRRLFTYMEFFSKLAIELSVSATMFSSILYIDDFSNVIENQAKVKLAQLQIYFLLFGVGTVLIKMIYLRVIKLFSKCQANNIDDKKIVLFF